MYFLCLLATEFASPTYIDRPETFPILLYEGLLLVAACMIGFLAVNAYLLATRGQTVGKIVMKTRIVDYRSGNLVPIVPLFLKRYLLVWLLVQIPFFGGIFNFINTMSIFRAPKRCIHDEIAGTKVVTTLKRHNERDLPNQIEIPSLDS